ncbi:pantetheine-phosphate adenylyltransferase [Roseisolibacter sp. H3M3-2]|uniref:pantetheine-phosphate adenylyltransferase n=1 Tax=Roseisolibacter sp. H3M3-2 TaxID=3031323 RepID=UPI0023DAB912|nr:pantetheine-phosphate adenylyltransferase [Roseisolibacter sp. H3M3-2]MDF1502191.1 pantetheine-phosphate adenylyltransferase [Roseisolibacter sp. H3M3-2]
MRTAIYAGSFDPVTLGHLDLMRRSLEFVDRLVVGVAVNSTKTPMFTLEERASLIRASLGELATGDAPRVEVRHFQGLLVDFARDAGATLSVRGLRAVADFEYEFQMALMNRHLAPTFETLFLVPSVETTFISSTLVREVARLGGTVDALVPPPVAAALRARFPR